jgi:hypothetical protein
MAVYKRNPGLLGSSSYLTDVESDYAPTKGVPGRSGVDGRDGREGRDGVDGNDGRDGEQGPQGLVGRQGIPGDTGPKGDTGLQGEQGIQGIPGKDGEPGKDGRDGIDGLPGPEGKVGPRGQLGPKGEQGDKGESGRDGIDGDKGVDGAVGPRGPKGDKGDKGDTGSKGEQGPEGPEGPKGDSGEKPVLGVDYFVMNGYNGKDGRDGIDGVGGGNVDWVFSTQSGSSINISTGASTNTLFYGNFLTTCSGGVGGIAIGDTGGGYYETGTLWISNDSTNNVELGISYDGSDDSFYLTASASFSQSTHDHPYILTADASLFQSAGTYITAESTHSHVVYQSTGDYLTTSAGWDSNYLTTYTVPPSGTLSLINGNGVSFISSSNGSTTSISASVETAYIPLANSTKFAGFSTGSTSTSGTDLQMTLNTSGISFGVPKWITTYSESTHAHPYMAANESHIRELNASNGSFWGGTVALVESGNITVSAHSAGSIIFSVPAQSTHSHIVYAATDHTHDDDVHDFYIGASDTTFNEHSVFMSAQTNITIGTSVNGDSQYIRFSVADQSTHSHIVYAQATHTHGSVSLDLSNITGSYSSASDGLTLGLTGATGGAPGGLVEWSTATTSAGTDIIISTGAETNTLYYPKYITTYAGGGGALSASNGSYTFDTALFGSSIGTFFTNASGMQVSYTVPPSGTLSLINTNGVSFISASNGSTTSISASVETAYIPLANSTKFGMSYSLSSSTGGQTAGTASSSFMSGSVIRFVAGSNITLSGDTYGIKIIGPDAVGSWELEGNNTAGTTGSLQGNILYLSGGNNVTLSGNSNTIIISGANAAAGDSFFKGWSLAGNNTAGTNITALGATASLYLSGGNNITLSGNQNTIVINAAAGGAAGTMSYLEPMMMLLGSATMSNSLSQLNLQPVMVPYNLSFGQINMIGLASLPVSTIVNTASFRIAAVNTVRYSGAYTVTNCNMYDLFLFSQGTGGYSTEIETIASTRNSFVTYYNMSYDISGVKTATATSASTGSISARQTLSVSVVYPAMISGVITSVNPASNFTTWGTGYGTWTSTCSNSSSDTINITIGKTLGIASSWPATTGWASNKLIPLQFATSVGPGLYWVGVIRSTSSNSASGGTGNTIATAGTGASYSFTYGASAQTQTAQITWGGRSNSVVSSLGWMGQASQASLAHAPGLGSFSAAWASNSTYLNNAANPNGAVAFSQICTNVSFFRSWMAFDLKGVGLGK